MNLLKKYQPSCLKFLEAKRGEGQQDIIIAEAMMCDLLVVKTCNTTIHGSVGVSNNSLNKMLLRLNLRLLCLHLLQSWSE